MKIKQLMSLALIGLAVGACKRPVGGEDPDVVEPEGKLVTARLAISIPKSIRTYAPDPLGTTDQYATDDEMTAERIDVFVYDNGGSYAVQHFEFTNFVTGTSPTGNSFAIDENKFLTAPFSVREGDKLVYVGINLPDFIVSRLATGYYVNEVFENKDLIGELINVKQLNGSSYVPYFSNERGTNVVFSSSKLGTDPEIDITVNRLVSKIIVTADNPDGGSQGNATVFEVSGGKVSNFEFTIGQRNNQMYVAPLEGLFGRGLEDPNYSPLSDREGVGTKTLATHGYPEEDQITMLQILSDVNTAGYKSVNENPIDDDFTDQDLFVHYTTENTTKEHHHEDVTYISVRAQFIPDMIGGDPESGLATQPNNDKTFNYSDPSILGDLYAVFTVDDALGSGAIGARYFYNLGDARDFVTGTYFKSMLELGGGTITVSANSADYQSGETDPKNSDF